MAAAAATLTNLDMKILMGLAPLDLANLRFDSRVPVARHFGCYATEKLVAFLEGEATVKHHEHVTHATEYTCQFVETTHDEGRHQTRARRALARHTVLGFIPGTLDETPFRHTTNEVVWRIPTVNACRPSLYLHATSTLFCLGQGPSPLAAIAAVAKDVDDDDVTPTANVVVVPCLFGDMPRLAVMTAAALDAGDELLLHYAAKDEEHEWCRDVVFPPPGDVHSETRQLSKSNETLGRPLLAELVKAMMKWEGVRELPSSRSRRFVQAVVAEVVIVDAVVVMAADAENDSSSDGETEDDATTVMAILSNMDKKRPRELDPEDDGAAAAAAEADAEGLGEPPLKRMRLDASTSMSATSSPVPPLGDAPPALYVVHAPLVLRGHLESKSLGPPKRRRGRPPGAKNKPMAAPVRRGRPPGAKNKPMAMSAETLPPPRSLVRQRPPRNSTPASSHDTLERLVAEGLPMDVAECVVHELGGSHLKLLRTVPDHPDFQEKMAPLHRIALQHAIKAVAIKA